MFDKKEMIKIKMLNGLWATIDVNEIAVVLPNVKSGTAAITTKGGAIILASKTVDELNEILKQNGVKLKVMD